MPIDGTGFAMDGGPIKMFGQKMRTHNMVRSPSSFIDIPEE